MYDLPLPGQVLFVAKIGEDYNGDPARYPSTNIKDVNIISSLVDGKPGIHRPVIDLDLSAALIPSSTHGHYQLYIDRELPWEIYLDLLRAMERAGIIQPGYLAASEERGHTAVRLPWVKKGAPDGD